MINNRQLLLLLWLLFILKISACLKADTLPISTTVLTLSRSSTLGVLLQSVMGLLRLKAPEGAPEGVQWQHQIPFRLEFMVHAAFPVERCVLKYTIPYLASSPGILILVHALWRI